MVRDGACRAGGGADARAFGIERVSVGGARSLPSLRMTTVRTRFGSDWVGALAAGGGAAWGAAAAGGDGGNAGAGDAGAAAAAGAGGAAAGTGCTGDGRIVRGLGEVSATGCSSRDTRRSLLPLGNRSCERAGWFRFRVAAAGTTLLGERSATITGACPRAARAGTVGTVAIGAGGAEHGAANQHDCSDETVAALAARRVVIDVLIRWLGAAMVLAIVVGSVLVGRIVLRLGDKLRLDTVSVQRIGVAVIHRRRACRAVGIMLGGLRIGHGLIGRALDVPPPVVLGILLCARHRSALLCKRIGLPDQPREFRQRVGPLHGILRFRRRAPVRIVRAIGSQAIVVRHTRPFPVTGVAPRSAPDRTPRRPRLRAQRHRARLTHLLRRLDPEHAEPGREDGDNALYQSQARHGH